MIKYEYKTLEYLPNDAKLLYKNFDLDSEEIEGLLNTLGEDGWELVNTVDYALNGFTRKVILFLKREKK